MQAVRKLKSNDAHSQNVENYSKLNERCMATILFCQVDLDIANLVALGRGRAACPNQNGDDPGSVNSWIHCIVCMEATFRRPNRQGSRRLPLILS